MRFPFPNGGESLPKCMAGLVLGITVTRAKTEIAEMKAPAPRRLRLLVGERKGVRLRNLPGLGYRLLEASASEVGGGVGKGVGEFTAPGPAIVLTRGQPVEITVETD